MESFLSSGGAIQPRSPPGDRQAHRYKEFSIAFLEHRMFISFTLLTVFRSIGDFNHISVRQLARHLGGRRERLGHSQAVDGIAAVLVVTFQMQPVSHCVLHDAVIPSHQLLLMEHACAGNPALHFLRPVLLHLHFLVLVHVVVGHHHSIGGHGRKLEHFTRRSSMLFKRNRGER